MFLINAIKTFVFYYLEFLFFFSATYSLIFFCLTRIYDSRIHYFEIHDQTWCPSIIRKQAQFLLHGAWKTYGVPFFGSTPAEHVAKVLLKCMKEKNQKNNIILDLCSGGGGPTPMINNYLSKNIKSYAIMSDLFPHNEAWESLSKYNTNLKYVPHPLDATDVQIKSLGPKNTNNQEILDQINSKSETFKIRTVCEAFHHFPPDLAKSIIQDAVNAKDGIMVVEYVLYRETFFDFFHWAFNAVFFSPFLYLYVCWNTLGEGKDLRLGVTTNDKSKLWFDRITTWFIQTLIYFFAQFIVVHDAIVSAARTYLIKDLEKMIKEIKNSDDYEWNCYRESVSGMNTPPLSLISKLTFLIGIPKKK